jgi:catechol 2,3-dioxygenase-like lactoylglutathione lyase family enzyme
MGHWYARPVLFVKDTEQAIRFYVEHLGFSEAWRHCEGGQALVAQVERSGCELLLSCQWPEKIGSGLIFISLDAQELLRIQNSVDRTRVRVRNGWWGYPVFIIEDADGNELYFPCEQTVE